MKITETEYILPKNKLNPKRHSYNNKSLKNLYSKYDKNLIDKEIGFLCLFHMYHDKYNTNLSIIYKIISDKGLKHPYIDISDYLRLSDIVNSELELNNKIKIRRIKRDVKHEF